MEMCSGEGGAAGKGAYLQVPAEDPIGERQGLAGGGGKSEEGMEQLGKGGGCPFPGGGNTAGVNILY